MNFTFSEYKQFIKEHESLQTEIDWLARGRKVPPQELIKKRFIEYPNLYRSKFPMQVLSVCPICNQTVSEAIDTFSLVGCGWWMHEPKGHGWYGRRFFNDDITLNQTSSEVSYISDCKCVQAVMYGVNLNGILPDDVRINDVYISSERPNVFVPFLEKEDSYAVIHTLPIGRVTDNVWEPRYTVYFISYFSKNLNAFKEAMEPENTESRDFVWPYKNLDYNLKHWIEKGKLFYLDSNFKLQNDLSYPYLNMQGLEGRWKIKYGRLILVPESLSGRDLLNTNHPFWKKTEEIGKSMLATQSFRKI